MQLELALKERLRLVRLAAPDASKASDSLLHLKRLALEKEDMYPGMARWFSEKVAPGLITGERAAVLIYSDETPIACGIVKRGQYAKLSHVSVRADFQRTHLGELLFALLAAEASGAAETVHFTLPEGLWHDKHEFFSTLAFRQAMPCVQQYRGQEPELRCEARFQDFWAEVAQRVPKILGRFAYTCDGAPVSILMSVKPEFAFKILSGTKTVEIRRRFSTRWTNTRVALYATQPIRRVVGTARVRDVVQGCPKDIWTTLGHKSGATYRQYEEYARGSQSVFAITLADPEPLSDEILGQWNLPMTVPRAPQSYCLLTPEHPWTRAVAADFLLRSLPFEPFGKHPRSGG